MLNDQQQRQAMYESRQAMQMLVMACIIGAIMIFAGYFFF